MSREVLLLAYGGPDTLDDVEPYLLDVRGGRKTPPHLVAEITERYRLIGGASPILARTREQATALERRLGLTVRVGMRHWHPYIRQAVEEAEAAGATELVAIPMSPFYSRMSVGAYTERLREALPASVEATLVHSWHLYPPYLAAAAERVREAREGWEDAAVVFTAHSLPERLKNEGDPYDDQLRAAAAAVGRACGIEKFSFAYQSPGRTPEPWMGPFVEDTMRDHARAGARRFVIVPIGFVCDHVEVLYDIDVVLAGLAAELGATMRRANSLNDSELFVEALAALVRDAMRQHADASFVRERVSASI